MCYEIVNETSVSLELVVIGVKVVVEVETVRITSNFLLRESA